MRTAAFLLLLVPLSARAAPLSPAEVSAGWLALFDGETTFGWKGEARVEKGTLVLGAAKLTTLTTTAGFGPALVTFSYRTSGKPATLHLHGKTVELPASMTWATARVEAVGKRLVLKYEGAGSVGAVSAELDGTDKPSPLAFAVPAGSTLALDRVALHPDPGRRARVLFNGRNLDGWKVFEGKGKTSRFTVTDEGWLNVRDGPGDLQTRDTYADFVLQLECKSNGKHLNSGIFFRARPGEYQMGYEAQIRNEFRDTPQKYLVEEHDPKTHALVGKREVLSPAFDYGTGAIYRRMPARKALSKDHEWFTMTVVARGRHFATWVNGVQAVDWTDNRAPADNARKGYRAEAGAISIQGHDPGTDLSFRNLRVLPLAR